MKDTLFVYSRSFNDGTKEAFCPYSAQVIGFLTYYPEVRETLDLVEIGFRRPREALVDMLGEQYQSAPMLILGGDPVAVPGVTVGEANGHRFVEKTIEILRYLAATRSVPGPH